jgi:probable phosphoglycerate mutase
MIFLYKIRRKTAKMRILIIRHGEPDYEHDSLTERGFKEAELLSEKLKNENITKIYCSPLGRAKATAAPTVKKTGLEPEILDWLTEFPASVKPNYAEFGIDPAYESGCPWNLLPQFWTKHDKFFDRHDWIKEDLYIKSKVPEVYERVGKGYNELFKRHGYERDGQLYNIREGTDEKQTIALFCHLGLGLSIISQVTTGALPFIWESFFLPTSSVTTLFTEKYPPYKNQAVMRIIGMGDVSHLYAGGLSASSSGLHSEIC